MSVLRFSPLCGLLLVLSSAAQAEDMAPSALNSLSATPPALSAAPVMDQNGHVLGKVEQVQTDQDGKPLDAAAMKAYQNPGY